MPPLQRFDDTAFGIDEHFRGEHSRSGQEDGEEQHDVYDLQHCLERMEPRRKIAETDIVQYAHGGEWPERDEREADEATGGRRRVPEESCHCTGRTLPCKRLAVRKRF